MANDVQTIEWGTEPGTRVEYIPLEGGGHGLMPFAQVVFSGSFTLEGSTSGDTGNAIITFPLPQGVAWQMQSWAAWIFGTTAAIATAWDTGIFDIFYTPNPDSNFPTQLSFPTYQTTEMTKAPAEFISMLVFGKNTRIVSSSTANNPYPDEGRQSPYTFLSWRPHGVANLDPVLTIGGGTTTQLPSGGVLTIVLTLLGYTLVQMRSALLFAGLDSRP